ITPVGPVHGTAVAAAAHSCALTPSGGVSCWGFNGDAGLGDGSRVDRSLPRTVSGLETGVAGLSAGVGDHRCVVDDSGGVLCWGTNQHGQLGDGSTIDRTEPVAVVGLSSAVASVSIGDHHTCAVTVSGNALCWGANDTGQL